MNCPATWTDEDWQALHDERAAIVEFDGGLPRRIAEATARGEVARAKREAAEAIDKVQAA